MMPNEQNARNILTFHLKPKGRRRRENRLVAQQIEAECMVRTKATLILSPPTSLCAL